MENREHIQAWDLITLYFGKLCYCSSTAFVVLCIQEVFRAAKPQQCRFWKADDERSEWYNHQDIALCSGRLKTCAKVHALGMNNGGPFESPPFQ